MPQAHQFKLEWTEDLVSVFDAAEVIVDKMKDDYTSTEHILLAMVQAKAATVRELLASFGVNEKSIMDALMGIRGTQRVGSPTPEDQYEALVKVWT